MTQDPPGSGMSSGLFAIHWLYECGCCRCIGAWDMVATSLDTIQGLQLQDQYLPLTVDFAFHAVSLHENRREFRPTLWNLRDDRQVLKEV